MNRWKRPDKNHWPRHKPVSLLKTLYYICTEQQTNKKELHMNRYIEKSLALAKTRYGKVTKVKGKAGVYKTPTGQEIFVLNDKIRKAAKGLILKMDEKKGAVVLPKTKYGTYRLEFVNRIIKNGETWILDQAYDNGHRKSQKVKDEIEVTGPIIDHACFVMYELLDEIVYPRFKNRVNRSHRFKEAKDALGPQRMKEIQALVKKMEGIGKEYINLKINFFKKHGIKSKGLGFSRMEDDLGWSITFEHILLNQSRNYLESLMGPLEKGFFAEAQKLNKKFRDFSLDITEEVKGFFNETGLDPDDMPVGSIVRAVREETAK